MRGFTLIELLVVIAIIGILSSVVLASMNASRAKGRYTTILSQVQQIQKAGEMAFATSYPADVGPNALPTEMVPYLQQWPVPPCPGWTYDWENWSSGGQIYVSVRKADNSVVMYYCIYDSVYNCGASANSANMITNWASKQITCRE
jgi:prepilin-type N-terminal cleavage/methylation domain-containing protein